MGHRVTIVAASFSHARYYQPEQTGKITTENIDGVRYIWLPVPSYNPKSGIARARNILTFSLVCRYSRLPIDHADLVICSSHHPFPIYAARHYARKFKARMVFEVRDLWPLTLTELGEISRYNPFIFLMQRAEDYAYKHADHVVSVLPEAKPYMVKHGMSPGKFVYIPNGADVNGQEKGFPLPPSHTAQLEKLRKDGKFIIGYAGKIGFSNALHTLIDAVGLCKDDQIVAALLGSGPCLDDLKRKAITLGIERKILFLTPVTKEQIPDFMEKIDVAWVGAMVSPLYRFGVSLTKLNDFMRAAKPVIYAVDAPENIIEESGAGITCPPEDPEKLKEAMLIMKSFSREEREAMGRNGRAWIIQNRDIKKLARRFLECVMSGADKNDILLN